MSFTKLKTSQAEFLEAHLRGTGRTISAAQARATYGIERLTARMTEFRHAGLQVRKTKNSSGKTAYAISRRDVCGDQYKKFN